jgi:hypothetical protein
MEYVCGPTPYWSTFFTPEHCKLFEAISPRMALYGRRTLSVYPSIYLSIYLSIYILLIYVSMARQSFCLTLAAFLIS